MVYTDANSFSHILAYTSGFEFLQRKSSSTSLFHIIPKGRASHYWSKLFHRPWSNCSGFLCSHLAPTLFSCWLVEPCFDIPIPILMEMGIWYHLIAFGRHLGAVFLRAPCFVNYTRGGLINTIYKKPM